MFKYGLLLCLVISAVYAKSTFKSVNAQDSNEEQLVQFNTNDFSDEQGPWETNQVQPHLLKASGKAGPPYGGKYGGKGGSPSSAFDKSKKGTKFYDYTIWDKSKDSTPATPTPIAPKIDTPTPLSPSMSEFWDAYGDELHEAYILSKYDIIKGDSDVPPELWSTLQKNMALVFDTTAARAQQIAAEGSSRTDIDSPTYQKPKTYKLKATAGDVTATPVAPLMGPAVYWKQFGQIIGETFNKTKNATTTGSATSGAGVSTDLTGSTPGAAPVIPGMMIGKAFVDAKSKLAKESKKFKTTTLSPITPLDGVDTAPAPIPVAPISEIDDVFWGTFSKALEDAVNTKNMLDAMKAAAAAEQAEVIDPATGEIVIDPAIIPVLQAYNLKLAMPVPMPKDKVTLTPDDPNYDEYMKAKADLVDVISKMKTNIPVAPIAPVATPAWYNIFSPIPFMSTPDMATTAFFPGAMYKDYGQNIAQHFITSKTDIAKSAATLKAFTSTVAPIEDSEAVEPAAYALKLSQPDPEPINPFAPIYWKMQFNPIYNPGFLSAQNPIVAGEVDDEIYPSPMTPMNPAIFWKGLGTTKASQAINTKLSTVPFFYPMYAQPMPEIPEIPEVTNAKTHLVKMSAPKTKKYPTYSKKTDTDKDSKDSAKSDESTKPVTPPMVQYEFVPLDSAESSQSSEDSWGKVSKKLDKAVLTAKDTTKGFVSSFRDNMV